MQCLHTQKDTNRRIEQARQNWNANPSLDCGRLAYRNESQLPSSDRYSLCWSLGELSSGGGEQKGKNNEEEEICFKSLLLASAFASLGKSY